jgi:hypothetical protein
MRFLFYGLFKLKIWKFVVSNYQTWKKNKFYNKVWCLHRRKQTSNTEKISILLKKKFFKVRCLVRAYVLFRNFPKKVWHGTVWYSLVLVTTTIRENHCSTIYLFLYSISQRFILFKILKLYFLNVLKYSNKFWKWYISIFILIILINL